MAKEEGAKRVIDWVKIKSEYINSSISTRDLAKKHDIKYAALRDRAAREQWVAMRAEHTSKTIALTEQKTAEKIADVQSEIAAISGRLHLKIMRHLEKQTDMLMQEEKLNTYDLRRITQSYKDMKDIDIQTAGSEEQHNALIDAIRKAAGADGD